MYFDDGTDLRFIPSGNSEDAVKSPIFRPLGFNIDNDIADRFNKSITQLFSTRQQNVDMSIMTRHLLTTLVQYLNGK